MSISLNKTYFIVSHAGTGLNLTIRGTSSNMNVWRTCLWSHDAGCLCQQWKLVNASGKFKLLSEVDNTYGLGYPAATGYGRIRNTVTYDDVTTIAFETIDATNNIYRIKQKNGSGYLTANTNRADGMSVMWAASNTSTEQQWKFIRIDAAVDYERILNTYCNQYAVTGTTKYWYTGKTQNDLTSDCDWGLSDTTSGSDNEFGNAVQCRGFVSFLVYKLTGSVLSSFTLENSPDASVLSNGWIVHRNNLTSYTLKSGDIVYYKPNNGYGHAAMVKSVDSSNNVTVIDCWGSFCSKIASGSFYLIGSSYPSMSALLQIATTVVEAT